MMKLNPSWFAFFLLILTGISLVISSDNIFSMWMGFELTLLGFLPMFTNNFLVVEGLMKYFLVQAGGSTIFLATHLWHLGPTSLLTTLAMMLKLGTAPCYQWVPSVMASLSWAGCFLLTTLQKISPLAVLSITASSSAMKSLLIVLGTLSILIGGIKGFNQTYLRPLMGYSSIAQTGWLILSATVSSRLLLMYFLLYTYITFTLFKSFQQLNTNKVVTGNHPPKTWLLATLLLLTMAGFPPLSLFFLKSLIFASLTASSTLLIPAAILMIVGTTVSIYYYLTFITPSLLVYWQEPSKTPWKLVFHAAFGALAHPMLLLV